MKFRRTVWRVLFLYGASLALWSVWKSLTAPLGPGEARLASRQKTEQVLPDEARLASRQKSELGVHVEQTSPFVFRQDFSFPQPRVMKSLEDIEKGSWMEHLHVYLSSFDRQAAKQLYLLTSNHRYIDVLLNWLISAVVRSKIPTHSILTISMDVTTHQTLRTRGFPSILVTPSHLFSHGANFSAPFERVMMLRLSLLRVINHFGFDVVMVDTDAIMLKDPQELLDAHSGADIVGSVGTIPEDLFAMWNVTICIGFVLVRSSERTEQYWNGMKDISRDCIDDQFKLNYGLKALDVKWSNSNSFHQNATIHGRARNGLLASILPYDDVCRLDTCVVEKRNRCYIWHKGGLRSRKDKLHSAREGMTWFLKYKWDRILNSYVGEDWLRSIAYLGVTLA